MGMFMIEGLDLLAPPAYQLKSALEQACLLAQRREAQVISSVSFEYSFAPKERKDPPIWRDPFPLK